MEELITSAEYNEEMLDSPETIEEVQEMIQENISQATNVPMNRAQRRHAMKKTGKKKIDLITSTAKKLNYINLIQKLRTLNEKKENEENEATTENC